MMKQGVRQPRCAVPSPLRRSTWRAFTLIELLIVVAIIAILAAIAVPNFLAAQTRAKVSRVQADHRTIATALESYAVDWNKYPPNDGVYNVVPIQISTPVAYVSQAYFTDPFTEQTVNDPMAPNLDLTRYYTYTMVVRFESSAAFFAWLDAGNPNPGNEGSDVPGYNEGALYRYGPWRLVSNGPDRKYASENYEDRIYASPFNPNPLALRGSDIPYDATNGTRSLGNILRTQRDSQQAKAED